MGTKDYGFSRCRCCGIIFCLDYWEWCF